jgi:hypothetical protein
MVYNERPGRAPHPARAPRQSAGCGPPMGLSVSHISCWTPRVQALPTLKRGRVGEQAMPKGTTASPLVEPDVRISQVPRLICPRALSPTTPEGLAAAFAPCFTASVRLHPRGWTGHLQAPLTRPNWVYLRSGSRVRLTRLRRMNYFISRSLGYLSNGQLQGKLLSAYKISQALPGTPP